MVNLTSNPILKTLIVTARAQLRQDVVSSAVTPKPMASPVFVHVPMTENEQRKLELERIAVSGHQLGDLQSSEEGRATVEAWGDVRAIDDVSATSRW